jgi:predicted Zn finger-like uncharacterized protein
LALREMIVTCPACRTRYMVAEPELRRPGGRTVRCANCGHRWRQEPAVADRPPPEPAPIALPVRELPPEGALPPVPDTNPAAVMPPRRHRGLAFGALAVLVLIGLAILALVVGRGWVAAAWPPAARLYAAVGLSATAPVTGLKIDKITPSRAADGLVIEGEIVNSARIALKVPRLRVALQDGAGKEVQFKIVDPPKALLQPGETAHFRTPFEHASDTATGVVVTFAPG